MDLHYEKSMSIAISIVTYNSQRDIEACLKSFVPTDYGSLNYEVYLWDNASTDHTCKIIEKYVNKYPQIFYLQKSKQNIGFGAAHNRVLLPKSSKYKVVCNPDIRILAGTLSSCINFVESHLKCGLVSPRIEYPNGEKQYQVKNQPTVLDLLLRRFFNQTTIKCIRDRMGRFEMKDLPDEIRYNIPYATGCFMFFRGDIFDEIKGFDERFFLHMEDADITRKAGLRYQVCYVPQIIVIHDWERKMHKSIKQTICTIESMTKYFFKWGWSWW